MTQPAAPPPPGPQPSAVQPVAGQSIVPVTLTPQVLAPSPAERRSALLKAVLPADPQLDHVISHVTNNTTAPPTAPRDLVQKAVLANKLADVLDNNEAAVKAVVGDPKIQSLRDVALNTDLHAVVEAINSAPGGDGSVTSASASVPTAAVKPLDVNSVKKKLFHAEPSAVLQKMVADGEVCCS